MARRKNMKDAMNKIRNAFALLGVLALVGLVIFFWVLPNPDKSAPTSFGDKGQTEPKQEKAEPTKLLLDSSTTNTNATLVETNVVAGLVGVVGCVDSTPSVVMTNSAVKVAVGEHVLLVRFINATGERLLLDSGDSVGYLEFGDDRYQTVGFTNNSSQTMTNEIFIYQQNSAVDKEDWRFKSYCITIPPSATNRVEVKNLSITATENWAVKERTVPLFRKGKVVVVDSPVFMSPKGN